MKRYVDGYVLTVPKNKLTEYKKLAVASAKVWIKHGALQYYESIGEDLQRAKKWGCLPFPTMVKPKRNEVILFSFIVYKSRKHRDTVNAKVIKDPLMDPEKWKDMPFDSKRMAVGGFETIVACEKK